MAGALTKYAAGDSISHLSQFNRRAVRPAREIKGEFARTAAAKQYLFASAGSQEKENGWRASAGAISVKFAPASNNFDA